MTDQSVISDGKDSYLIFSRFRYVAIVYDVPAPRSTGAHCGGLQRWHTVALAGQSLLLNANAPNFGSMYVMLDEFHDRVAAHRTSDNIADELRQLFQREIQDADINILGAPPIEGLRTAGGFRIVIQDRGDNGLKMLETVSQGIVSDGSEDS